MAECLCVVGILGQLDWSWPIISGVTLVAQRTYAEIESTQGMLDVLRIIIGMYEPLRVCDGVLVRTKKGLVPLGNPSERVSGTVRYRKLAEEMPAWYKTCQALSMELMRPASGLLVRMLKALRQHPTEGYPGRIDYGHIRICRLFAYAVGRNAKDSAADWAVYKRCSRHVAAEYHQLGIATYEDAIGARDFLRAAVGMPHYNLSDLAMYVCIRGCKGAKVTDGPP